MQMKIIFLLGAISLFIGCTKSQPQYTERACYVEEEQIKQSIFQRRFAFFPITHIKLCVPGGLYSHVQCSSIIGCFCAYVDTGNYRTSLPRFTFQTLLHLCIPQTEKAYDGCKVPFVNYPCQPDAIKYRYNQASQKCEPVQEETCFGYTDIETCQESCEPQELDKCSFPADSGDTCEENDPKIQYRFNSESNTCEKFLYNGCGGNANNYEYTWQCRMACGPQSSVTTFVEVDLIAFYEIEIPTWLALKHDLAEDGVNLVDTDVFMDIEEHALNITFISQADDADLPGGGDSILERNFEIGVTDLDLAPTLYSDLDAAREDLDSIAVCTLPDKTGPCRAYFPRWYFDVKTVSCKRFVFGGCLPNYNNFQEEAECLEYCDSAFSLFGRVVDLGDSATLTLLISTLPTTTSTTATTTTKDASPTPPITETTTKTAYHSGEMPEETTEVLSFETTNSI